MQAYKRTRLSKAAKAAMSPQQHQEHLDRLKSARNARHEMNRRGARPFEDEIVEHEDHAMGDTFTMVTADGMKGQVGIVVAALVVASFFHLYDGIVN